MADPAKPTDSVPPGPGTPKKKPPKINRNAPSSSAADVAQTPEPPHDESAPAEGEQAPASEQPGSVKKEEEPEEKPEDKREEKQEEEPAPATPTPQRTMKQEDSEPEETQDEPEPQPVVKPARRAKKKPLPYRSREASSRELSGTRAVGRSRGSYDDALQRQDRRRRRDQQQQMVPRAQPGQLGDFMTFADQQQVAQPGAQGDQDKKEKEKDNTLSLRLDLNLEIEVQLKAHIHGDLTLSLLS
ncbi:hypothetical protein BO71DRAFT_396452 [Aspergillus ellipticus CBS 707.79]|uniref:Uncharacterized protein n=1 Tax=Aspergillus ellipticus CBS 707.79 TaxID=1448320 RepID=A0A319DI22_9EURO|nr:hypothetical protein BO71DRAFT_396452 [Aspergillus ellipticus CBS 707.79]